MIHSRRAQAGITLIITLMMLVMFTLFAVAAIRLANVNLRLVGNYQWQKEMESLTDSAIEQLSSNVTNFYPTPAADLDICRNGTIATTGTCSGTRLGTISAPRCLSFGIESGSSLDPTQPIPEITNWQVTARATDDWTGAQVVVTRGLSIRLLAGNCVE